MTYTQEKQLEANAQAPCNCDQSIELQNKLDKITLLVQQAEIFGTNISPKWLNLILEVN
tara:strand:- start:5404 stop:5580 length:177 start_codon:yes stop_codon:yes gene_type:complete